MKNLIKFSDVKLLVDADISKELLIKNAKNICELNSLVNTLYRDALGADQFLLDEIKRKRNELDDFVVQSGVIGSPFDLHDAELYALDRNLEFEVLELEIEK